jgi:hypothetical protein
MMRTNVGGTANIVNVCLEKNIPLCHVSSIAALGRSNSDAPINENDIWQTAARRSAYSFSKYKSEMEVWRGIAEGLQAVIVELFNRIAAHLGVRKPSIAVQPWMLHIAYRLSWLAATLTGRSPTLTKETAHSAFQQKRYSGEKIEKTLGYKFITLEKSIEECCGFFGKYIFYTAIYTLFQIFHVFTKFSRNILGGTYPR